MSAKFKGIIGTEELLANLADVCGSIEEACEKTIKQAQQEMIGLAKQKVSVDTGFLRDSIQASPVIRDGNTYTGFVDTAEHGVYQEFGTGMKGQRGADLESAFNNSDFADKLHFTLKKNGEDYQGIVPHPFFYPALVEMRDKFKDGAIELITDAINSGGE